MISNHESKEKTDESKDSIESKQNEEERPKSPAPSSPRKSPEPTCAICLERITDKSFTESCYHMFCFTCLLEWSKVKPECPLCKKNFTIIVHNFRSHKDYDQYFVTNKSRWNLVESRTSNDSRPLSRRARALALEAERIHERTRLELDDYLSHRMRFAPHSVHSFRISYSSTALMPSRRPIPNSFRQRVYDENLWVFPLNSGRVRCISPEFFRQNIACTHRLLPWLNRELLVVMPNNEAQVTFVLELIMALIVKYDIRSKEFQTLIEPYTGSHTAHFIHEFYNFASSPFETLDSYDNHAQYDLPQTYERVSSPDSDVIPLPMDYSNPTQQSTSNASSRRKKQSHPRKKSSKGSKKLKKLILKKNAKNVWESVSPYYIPSSVTFEFSGPSTSREIPFLNSPDITDPEIDVVNGPKTIQETINIDDDDDDDDECEIIDVLKPKKERTPEIVNLSSDDETYIVGDVIIEDIDRTTVISTAVGGNDQIVSVSDDDDDIEIVYCTDAKPANDITNNEVVPDKPIDYSLKTIETKFDTEINAPTAAACSSNTDFEQDVSDIHKFIHDSKLESIKTEKDCVIKSVICAKPDEEASTSFQTSLKPKKRRAVFLDEDSTESSSDNAKVSEVETRRGKLKLKSVVAHFSVENSDGTESTHHSSMRKKHRERKKKKRKHKHRRRIYSSDSD